MNFIGEIAALITSLSFAFTATFFTFAGRSVGSEIVNRTRLGIALIVLTLIHWGVIGTPLPWDAVGYRWVWLGLSGVVGLALGDAFLFQSYLMIGPRLGMLMMSLAPVIAAFLAWITLGESLNMTQSVGILLAVAGIGVVVADRGKAALPIDRAQIDDFKNPVPHSSSSILNRFYRLTGRDKVFALGLLFALLGALGQAAGLTMAKYGLGGDFSPISANLIRSIAANGFLWVYYAVKGQVGETARQLRKYPRSTLHIALGAMTGPVIGVSFSMLALQRTAVGIASTLIATTPIFLLPVGYLVFNDRFGWRSIAGTLITVFGVSLLFVA